MIEKVINFLLEYETFIFFVLVALGITIMLVKCSSNNEIRLQSSQTPVQEVSVEPTELPEPTSTEVSDFSEQEHEDLMTRLRRAHRLYQLHSTRYREIIAVRNRNDREQTINLHHWALHLRLDVIQYNTTVILGNLGDDLEEEGLPRQLEEFWDERND